MQRFRGGLAFKAFVSLSSRLESNKERREVISNVTREPFQDVHRIEKVPAYEQLLGRIVKRFRGGLVFKAQRLSFHSTLGSIVIKKKKSTQVI